VLRREVDRLIADDRSRQFASGFTHQWLGLDSSTFFSSTSSSIAASTSTKAAAREEVYQTMSYLLRENQSLSRLLKSDFVVINGLLANYYRLAGVDGDAFRKVSLPAGSSRGGLLGMAAILAMGSNGQYQPRRARRVGAPQAAPRSAALRAPNVPQLARLGDKLLDVRERLRMHQKPAMCELPPQDRPHRLWPGNFDAAGKWRTEDTYERKGGAKKTWPSIPPPPSTTAQHSKTSSNFAPSSRRIRTLLLAASQKPLSNTPSVAPLASAMKTSRQAL